MKRRAFLLGGTVAAAGLYASRRRSAAGTVRAAGTAPTRRVTIADVKGGEDVFAWLTRVHGRFDLTRYRQVLGAANPYKEGDDSQGLAATDDATRQRARVLLANTTIASLIAHPIFADEVVAFADAQVDAATLERIKGWRLGALRAFLLEQPEDAIKGIMPGLPSDIIGCVVKLMSNDDLIAVGNKVFNPLPGSNIGAKGYMGARLQPNSPTDHPDDIVLQVLDGWSYGVGDVVLGTNPVSSDVDQVAAIEIALRDLLIAFELEHVLPHCVLSHIDVQAAVEKKHPG